MSLLCFSVGVRTVIIEILKSTNDRFFHEFKLKRNNAAIFNGYFNIFSIKLLLFFSIQKVYKFYCACRNSKNKRVDLKGFITFENTWSLFFPFFLMTNYASRFFFSLQTKVSLSYMLQFISLLKVYKLCFWMMFFLKNIKSLLNNKSHLITNPINIYKILNKANDWCFCFL